MDLWERFLYPSTQVTAGPWQASVLARRVYGGNLRVGIRAKLLGGFGLMVVFIIAVGFIGVSTAQRINNSLQDVGKGSLERPRRLPN